MIVALAVFVSLAAALGSLNRIRLVATPTVIDVSVLANALRTNVGNHGDVLRAVEGLAASDPRAEWEREFVLAARCEGGERTARLSELVGEFNFRLERWVRVPRVLASVSSSACFLLATLLLRRGLTTEIVLDENGILGVDRLVMQAVNVAALGLAGTAVCVAAQLRARRMARTRAGEVDSLAELIERPPVGSAREAAPVGPGGGGESGAGDDRGTNPSGADRTATPGGRSVH